MSLFLYPTGFDTKIVELFHLFLNQFMVEKNNFHSSYLLEIVSCWRKFSLIPFSVERLFTVNVSRVAS